MDASRWPKYIPRWPSIHWTWGRISLLAFALFSLVDSLFIPMSRDVDPGRASEGILFLILTFRAASRFELPMPVLIAGGCLSVLVSALNHRLMTSPSLIWTPAALVLLAIVILWDRVR